MKNHTKILIVLFSILGSVSLLFTSYCIRYVDIYDIITYCLDFERTRNYGQEFTSYSQPGSNFKIKHYETGYRLEFVEDEKSTVLLDDVTDYRGVSDNLNFYVVSDFGYALLLPDYTAVICLNDNNSQKYSSKKIIYIDSYDEFSQQDQKQFAKMRNL